MSPADGLCGIVALLDALNCGALLVDRSGRVVHANRRLCDMMQRACTDVVGMTLLELYPHEDRGLIQAALDHFDEPREQEFHLPRADGSRLEVLVSGRPLDGLSQGRDHRVVTVTDISRQKRAERDLRQRYEDVAALSDTVLAQALDLKRYAQHLEQRVYQRTLELREANMEAIYMLAVASEAKDFDTGAHVRRIETHARRLALALGLAPSDAERVAYSAILHDVGKIHVPDEILHKPGELTEAEWEVMRSHTVAGERILSRSGFFDEARRIARSHHENWDGSGYPDGLRAAAIPLSARIVRVADVYDALAARRPYKPAWPAERAAAEIVAQSGRLFDPAVVAAFDRTLREPGPDV